MKQNPSLRRYQVTGVYIRMQMQLFATSAKSFWQHIDFTILLSFWQTLIWESNTANQTINNICYTTRSSTNNTKNSYLPKRSQSEILQKLVNLLSNMLIHSYILWSYVYTFHSQWKVSNFFLRKRQLGNIFQVKDGGRLWAMLKYWLSD
jgi:hypothetical protein